MKLVLNVADVGLTAIVTAPHVGRVVVGIFACDKHFWDKQRPAGPVWLWSTAQSLGFFVRYGEQSPVAGPNILQIVCIAH